MSRTIVLGQSDRHNVTLDLDVLVRSRALVQASSGNGKSWTLRRLLEQSHGRLQQIVLDPEGEFSTLRERYDYVLVGKGGDVAADPRYAGTLARRLIELGASAILDLFELRPDDRRRFVYVFLEALINLPKELWHPCLVALDEAHDFCPEKGQGEAESTKAVIDLTTRGRKRRFCAVLATQRISKLHKDAAAECKNRLIGGTTLDIDLKRAAYELGFHQRADVDRLKALDPGQFFCYGPAISKTVLEVTIGGIETSEPEVGAKAAPAPPPREKVRAILSKLADLPREAEEELQTVAALRSKVRTLERDLSAARRQVPAAPVAPAPKAIRVEIPVVPPAILKRLEAASEKWLRGVTLLQGLATSLASEGRSFSETVAKANGVGRQSALPLKPAPPKVDASPRGGGSRPFTPESARFESSPGSPAPPAALDARDRADAGNAKLGLAERKILAVLSQFSDGRTATQVAVLTGYTAGGGGFGNALGVLRRERLMTGGGRGDPNGILRITEAGLALGPWPPLPAPGPELLAYWQRELGHAEREILRVLADVYPESLDVEDVAARAISTKGRPYTEGGGGFGNALGRLRTLEIIVGRGAVRLNHTVMEG